MLSKDINAAMNYSVMTTRSVIKKSSANICTMFWGGWAEQGIDARTPLKINMTNWQIICSIRIAEQVCRWGASATGWHSYQAKPEAWWEIPCLCDSDLERCTRRIPQEKKVGYSPWYSLKFDCRRHPAPLPLCLITSSFCFWLLNCLTGRSRIISY